MHSTNAIAQTNSDSPLRITHEPRQTSLGYAQAEQHFMRLLATEKLDETIAAQPQLIEDFERALKAALALAYERGVDHKPTGEADASAAHLFLQRTLYRINRLNFFWYDSLSNYDNERSDYLRDIHRRIETAWSRWELQQLDFEALRRLNVKDALTARCAYDLNPEPSVGGRYFREAAGAEGYRRLLEIYSLDSLIEASQLSRTLGGASNKIHAMITRVFVEEYGGGKLPRKHSTFYAQMLEEMKMSAVPEFYFDVVPWEVLAAINHSFFVSERKRNYLRYVGGLLYTEISVPASFSNYQAAAERLNIPSAAKTNYWNLHVREDERHGQWMINDVALPLAELYPQDAWEIVLGYDQQRHIGDRAGESIARVAREADAQSTAQAHGQSLNAAT